MAFAVRNICACVISKGNTRTFRVEYGYARSKVKLDYIIVRSKA